MAKQRKPYVLIAVSGEIAEVVRGERSAEVEIIDFDNLKDFRHSDGTGSADFVRSSLSRRAQVFLKTADPGLYESLYGPVRNIRPVEQAR